MVFCLIFVKVLMKISAPPFTARHLNRPFVATGASMAKLSLFQARPTEESKRVLAGVTDDRTGDKSYASVCFWRVALQELFDVCVCGGWRGRGGLSR